MCDFSHTSKVCYELFFFVFGLCGAVRCCGKQFFLQICGHADGNARAYEREKRNDHGQRALAEHRADKAHFAKCDRGQSGVFVGGAVYKRYAAFIVEGGAAKLAVIELNFAALL